MSAIRDEWTTEDGSVRLLLGDCLEILPQIGMVDACVTDPPYGIGAAWKGGFSGKHGWAKAKGESELRNEWDDQAPSEELFNLLRSMSRQQVIWGGNYFPLPPSRCWLVWNKPERNFSLAEAELAWTNRDNVVRVIDCPRSEHGREHPTQKPIRVMEWSVEKTTGTVLDPFMGSGTTGVACIRLNRRFIGIEKETKYFEIAKKRIQNELAKTALIETPKKLVQTSFVEAVSQ